MWEIMCLEAVGWDLGGWGEGDDDEGDDEGVVMAMMMMMSLVNRDDDDDGDERFVDQFLHKFHSYPPNSTIVFVHSSLTYSSYIYTQNISVWP